MARDMPSGASSDGDTSVVPNLTAVKELWDVWEVHVLILASLFLQVFLFFFAGIRRRSSSSILRIVLWLAYLSADSVAVFVLGNLAVHAAGPRHQLMYFWAPFVLVHLGGQDTITAFSRQDNELWRRHLLNLFTQVAIAIYVVAKESWPDRRLRAAMVIMFLLGCFKYAERTFCLYMSSPRELDSNTVGGLDETLRQLKQAQYKENNEYQRKNAIDSARENMTETLDMMLKGSSSSIEMGISDIMSEDAPRSTVETVLIADDIPEMLKEFKSHPERCRAYKPAAECLEWCYQRLHTKVLLRQAIHEIFWELMEDFSIVNFVFALMFFSLIVFELVSAPIALVLFTAAEKGDRHHTSRADITVSYILLTGAIILDAHSFFSSLVNIPNDRIKSVVSRVANYIQSAGSRKQWSEEVSQYNITKARSLLSGEPSIRRFGKRLAARFGFGTTTHIPITENITPIKEVILDNLLHLGTRKEWNITSSHGKLALQKWMDKHQDPDSASVGKAIGKCISLDFPISVLIWHIATDMCYYCGDKDDSSTNGINRDKQVSRELSNYIMYLVYKCGVKRTTSSQVVHDRADLEIKEIFGEKLQLDEKDAIKELFDHKDEEHQPSSTNETKKHEERDEQHDSTAVENLEELVEKQHDSTGTEIQKPAERASSNLDKLVQNTLEAIDSPVLPRAREVALKLIGINDAAERWNLIVGVWLEMLYYAAPRCGGAFHYEHLSTGGEFITHVLLLMRFLGPFLPPPSA